jgi:hypothetical protein
MKFWIITNTVVRISVPAIPVMPGENLTDMGRPHTDNCYCPKLRPYHQNIWAKLQLSGRNNFISWHMCACVMMWDGG